MKYIEDIYEEIGGLGWFQVVIILTIISSQVACGWSMLQMAFAGVVPDFKCSAPCRPDQISTESCNDGGYYLLNDTFNKLCSFNGTDCHIFHYDTDSATVIVEWDLVCDRKWAKQTIISIQMAGVLVGTVFAGQLSDLFGRKRVLAGFVLGHLLFSISAAFSVSWVMFAAIRFFAGVGIGGVVVVVFPYEMEFLPLKWRPVAAIIPSWSLGVSIFAGMAWWLDDWKHLHIACGLAGIPPLIGICLIPESIRWQVVHGQINEAEATLAKIAMRNKKRLPEATLSVLKNFSHEQANNMQKARSYTYLDLFRRFWTAKVSLIVFFYWFSMAIAYYGIAFGVASLSGNLYLNIFLLGVIEIPVQVTTFFLNNRFGRRKTTFFFCLGSLLPSIGCLALQLFARGGLREIGINVCSQVAKMMVGSLWSCVQLWGNEIFPTVIRNLGGGFTVLGARIGGVVAPFIMNLDDMPAAAYAILCALLLTDCILVTCLPETRGKSLCDTLDQERGALAVGSTGLSSSKAAGNEEWDLKAAKGKCQGEKETMMTGHTANAGADGGKQAGGLVC